MIWGETEMAQKGAQGKHEGSWEEHEAIGGL